MYYIYIYSAFWIIFLTYTVLIKKGYRCLTYIAAIWSLSSIASIIYSFALDNYDSIQILPYVFLICCLFASFYPFYINNNNLSKILIGNKSLFYNIIILISIISILPFFENLIHIIKTYGATNTETLADVYMDKMSGDFDRTKFINWFSLPGRIGNSINLKFQYCSLFLFFTYLSMPKRKRTYSILLFICAINPVLYQLGMSGRSTLVFLFLRAIFLFLLFYDFMDMQVRKTIIKYGLIFAGVGFLLLSIITLARYNANNGNNSISLLAWISLYIGEGSINFNNYMWNTNAFTEGDNCFSFFKNLLGFDTFTDYLERREFWGPKTGVDPVRFYTFVGDIYSDISYFVFPLLLIIGILLHKSIAKNNISLFKLYLYYTWGYICISGITCYTLKTYQSMIDMTFSLVIIYLISKRNNKSNIQILISQKTYDNDKC